jgi:glutamate 5-kinase
MKRVVIKLGSSIVADERGELRREALARICQAAAGLNSRGVDVVVVSSGAIATGIRVMNLPARPAAISELQAASAVGQGKLYRVYEELLRERGVVSAQVLLTFSDLSARTQYLNARQTLTKLLEWKVVAVINENDTTATDEISFGDNDFLAAQVALLLSADLLVLLTDIDGLYSADPRVEPAATLVEQVSDFNELAALEITSGTSPHGSGGMRSKVVAAEMVTGAGIAAVICNGVRAGVLEAVLAGESQGTRFAPSATPHSSFKLWLKYAKPSRGQVYVDSGAAHAVREGSASLLPVGVTEVHGSFDAGDAVEILERDAADGGRLRPFAKGICNYSATELAQVKGMKSDAVRDLLPDAIEEVVHRDFLVLE